jgi:hypothetical protein
MSMTAYVTVEEATTYFASRLHAEAWASAAETDKPKALTMATRAINRQPLRPIGDEVPQAVKDATCEEALALLERGNSQRRKLQAEGVVSMNIGGLGETYAVGSGKGLLSQEAKELLRPWLLRAVTIT